MWILQKGIQMKKNPALFVCLLLAGVGSVSALSPQAKLGRMTLGAQYGSLDSKADSVQGLKANSYGLHVGAEVSILEMLFLKDIQEGWRFKIGDIFGWHMLTHYAAYDAGAGRSAPGPYLFGYNLVLGGGGIFAVSDDIDVGFKFVIDARGLYWGSTQDEQGIVVTMPLGLTRWKALHLEAGYGSGSGIAGEEYGLTILDFRYLMGSEQMIGSRFEFASEKFRSTEDDITLINLYWGFTF